MRRICVVEDDESIREAVLYALRASGFDAVGYEGAEGFFKDISNDTALVILDVMLPGDDGLAILKKLRSYPGTKNLPVIMLTAKGSDFDKVTGLDLGADDYITKPFNVMEMISRVNAVLRRTGGTMESVGTEVFEYQSLRLDHSKRIVTVDATIVQLTYKEYELLYFLLINGGLALSRDKIIEEVWGYDFEGESRTLDMHIRTLRQKLGRAGKYITTIRNFGYKLGQ